MKKYLPILLLLCAGHVLADITGKVVAVTDGDTIKVLDANNTQYKIRLTGIDAPESAQPFGNASRKHLASMLAGVVFHTVLQITGDIWSESLTGERIGAVT